MTLKRPESYSSLIGTVASHIEYSLNRSLLTTTFVFAACHQATKDNTEVVHVDGSHLHKKGKHFENTGDLMAFLDPHLPQSSDGRL